MAPAEVAPMASDNQQAPAPHKAPVAEMDIPTPAQSSARSPTIASLAKKPEKTLTLKEQRALYAAKAKAAGNNTEPSIRTVKVSVPRTSKPSLNRSTTSTSTAPKSNTRNPSSNKIAKKPTTSTNRLKSTTKSNSTIFRPAPKKKPTIKEKRETYEATEKASHLKAAVIVGKPGEWAKTWQKQTSFLDDYVKAKLESKSTATSSPADVKKKPLTLKEQRADYAAKGKVIVDLVRDVQVAAPRTTTTPLMKGNVRPCSSMSSKSPENHPSADNSSTPESDSGIAQKENVRPFSSSNKSMSSKNRPTANKQSSDHHSTTTAAPVVKKKAPTLKTQREIHEATEKASYLKVAVIVGVPGRHAQIWGPKPSSTSPESSTYGSPAPKKKALTLKEQMARYAARRASDSASASPNTSTDTEEAPGGSRRTSTSSSSRGRARSPTREPSSSPSRSRSRSPTLPPLVRKPLTAKKKLALHAARREAAIAAKEKAAALSGSSRRASADSAVSSASNNISGPAPIANMIAPIADMDITPTESSTTNTVPLANPTTSTSKENVPFNNNTGSFPLLLLRTTTPRRPRPL